MTMLKVSACIKNASLYAHLCSPMFQVRLYIKALSVCFKCLECLVSIGKWCPGPELNRHARSLVTQDFKSCVSKSQVSNLIREIIKHTSKCASKMHHLMSNYAHLCATFHVLTFNSNQTIQAGGHIEFGNIWRTP